MLSVDKNLAKTRRGAYKKTDVEPFSKRQLRNLVLGLTALAKISVGIYSYRAVTKAGAPLILSYPGHKRHRRLVGVLTAAVQAGRELFKVHIGFNGKCIVIVDYVSGIVDIVDSA